MEIETLAAGGYCAQNPIAQMGGDSLDARHEVFAIESDGAQLAGVLVEQQDRERFRAHDVEDDFLNDLDDFSKIERGVELVAGHVEAGQIVVLLLDLGVAGGVVLVFLFERAQPASEPLVLPQELLGELLALVEQLEKLVSSRIVGHLSARLKCNMGCQHHPHNRSIAGAI